jgi:hypothetical protein
MTVDAIHHHPNAPPSQTRVPMADGETREMLFSEFFEAGVPRVGEEIIDN